MEPISPETAADPEAGFTRRPSLYERQEDAEAIDWSEGEDVIPDITQSKPLKINATNDPSGLHGKYTSHM